MIRSMTGFARLMGSPKKGGWIIEIRSLNHRFFEFSVKLPPALYGLEDQVREVCQTLIRRGKVTVAINNNGNENSSLEEVMVDEEVLKFYLTTLRKVQRRFAIKGSISISDVLSLPRIFTVEKKAEAPVKIWPSLKRQLEDAMKQLNVSRLREGKTLSRDLLMRIDAITKTLQVIEKRTRELPKEYFEKLQGRIQNLFEKRIGEEGDRVWHAAALIAEKSDITEEVVRLQSHLRLFREKISGEGEVGKELDFLLQEMNREANTMSSKAQDFEISKEVVFIKSELEKIREQIQNIE